jgi:hypothetical protein
MGWVREWRMYKWTPGRTDGWMGGLGLGVGVGEMVMRQEKSEK